MKNYLLLSFLVFLSLYSNATHLMGGEITARQLNDTTYEVTLTAYRDTAGIPFGTFHTFDVYDGNGVLINSYYTNYDTSVSGGLLANYPYGVEVYVVIDTVTLPGPGTYHIAWSNCCRNGAIQNLSAPLSESMYLETVLTVYPPGVNNSSPVFLVFPVIYLPVNQAWTYNPLPFDPDSDSLYWSLDTPLTTFGTNVAGYTTPPSDPLNVFSINPGTGEISWTATTLGNFNATVLVEEFRGSTKIGEIRRDMQFIVVPSDTNDMARITNLNLIPADEQGNPQIKIRPGDYFELKLLASDPNENDPVYLEAYGQPFLLTDNAAQFSVTPTGNGNEIEGEFSWQTGENLRKRKPYVVVFRVKDHQFVSDVSILFKVDWPVGIEEVEEVIVSKIFPNPVRNMIYVPISLKNTANVKINIYNMLGSEVMELPEENFRSGNHVAAIPVDLKNGQYFIRIQEDNNLISTQKFIIIND